VNHKENHMQPFTARQGDEVAVLFFSRVDVGEPGACWEWQGPRDRRGYGRDMRRATSSLAGSGLAHRIAFFLRHGGFTPETELDHTCSNPACVNPDHLEEVSHAENVRRGRAGEVNAARQRALTRCKRGHPFSSENTYTDHRGHRGCRQCTRDHHRRYNEERKSRS